MKFTRLAAAVCGMAMVSGSAHAALSFTAQRSAVSGTLDRVVLFAKSDASTGATANVLGAEMALSTPTANGLKFSVTDTDDDGVVDSVNAFQTPVNAATRTRADSQVFALVAAVVPNPGAAGAATVFQPGLTNWSITAAASNNGVGYLADSTVNNGSGYAVITAVVPTGSAVTFTGSVSDSTTTKYPVAITNTAGPDVPEPTSLAFLGLGAMGLMARRRR